MRSRVLRAISSVRSIHVPVGARRAEEKLSGVDRGEDLPADLPARRHQRHGADHQITRHQRSAVADLCLEDAGIPLLEAPEEPRGRRAMVSPDDGRARGATRLTRWLGSLWRNDSAESTKRIPWRRSEPGRRGRLDVQRLVRGAPTADNPARKSLIHQGFGERSGQVRETLKRIPPRASRCSRRPGSCSHRSGRRGRAPRRRSVGRAGAGSRGFAG